MVNKLTRRLIGILAMMVLMMTTSLSARAAYVLKGSFNNWGDGIAMTQDGDTWTLTKDFAVGEEFKFQEDGTWVGAKADGQYYGVTASVLNNGTVIELLLDGGQNLHVDVAGTYTIVIDADRKMRIGTKAPVTVKSGIAHGNVAVNPTQAFPSEIITITATPADGYYIEVGNIKVEKTVNGDVAQAPGMRGNPGVGEFITDIQAGSEPNTFTFAMPESPYGAQVSAEFQECTALTEAMFKAIPEQDLTGQQITPPVECAEGYNLVLDKDYTVEYGENIGPGQHAGIVTITGIGKYKGEVVLYFDIKQGVHTVNITTDGNGTVTAEPASGVAGTEIILTITPKTGYELDKLKVDGNEVTVTNNSYTFNMPDADVAVNATFKLIDYTITVTQGENGTVAVVDNLTTAHYGDVITLTNTPNEDCVFVSYTVTDAEGNTVAVENNQFTMPASNVTVTATFNALSVAYEMRWGVGSPWSDQHSVALEKDEATGKLVAENNSIPVGYEAVLVKIVDGQEVLMGTLADGDYWITAEYLANPVELPMSKIDNTHHNLYFPNAGIYSFSYDVAEKKLVVTGDFTYTITVTNEVEGQVTVDKTVAKAEETVTITVNADKIPEGYEIDAVKVNDSTEGVTQLEEAGKYTFVMPAADVTVTVTFKASTYTITVAQGIEHGTVEAPESAQYGSDVNVIVNPDPGYELATLTYTIGDGEPVPIENNTFTMPAGDVTINATFKKATYTITVAEGIENGSVTAPVSAQYGDEVTVAVTTNPGYVLKTLTYTVEGGEAVPIENNKFSMPAGNVTINATFEAINYNITVAETQNGTVVPSKTTANVGDVITLEVTPLGDYELETLTYTVEGGQPVTIENNQFTMPASDVTITATFKPLDVTYKINYGKQGNPWTETGSITMTKNAEGKWVTDGQVIPAGFEAVLVRIEGEEELVMQAYATDLYWITDANLVDHEPLNMGTAEGYVNIYFPKAGNYTFTYNPVDKKMLVDGVYVYYINITEPTNGTVTTSPAGPVAAGTTVTINAIPEDDYQVASINVTYGENNTEVNVTDNQFEMPAADVTVTVTFTEVLHNNALTWNVDNASLEVKVDNVAITSGTEVQERKEVKVTVSQTPEQAAEWTVSKVSIVYGTTTTELTAAEGVYSFEMPAAATEIKVEFTAVQHGITITPNEFVTVTTDPSGEAAAGQEVTVTVTPNNPDDFVVGDVKVNGESIEPNADGTYTFTMPAGDSGVTIDVVVEAKIQGVSFTADRNWATYIGAYNLVKPEGVKVYVVNGVVSNAVDITEIDYIPANVGVLLYGTAGEDLTTPLYTGETATYTSKLAGSATASQAISAGYVLYNNNFIRSEEGTLAAHRCYLPASEVAGAPHMLKIGYDGDVPTAIENILASGNVAGVKYVNMSGMTSDKPFNGINIAVVTMNDGTVKTIKLVK